MRNKGITLIALVITIIVLLILAVVSINFLTNHGIIKKSSDSAKKYNMEQIKEELTTTLSSMIMDNPNIMSEDNYTIEQTFNNILSSNVHTYLRQCNEEYYSFTYKKFLWKINRDSKLIEFISEANSDYTGDGSILDGLSIIQQMDLARKSYTIPTQDVNGGYNIFYSSGLDYSDDNIIDITQNGVKTTVKLYSGNNIMIYDNEKSAPYFPIMAMYNCEGSSNSKKRGLTAISVNGSDCLLSTPNPNNDWYFGHDAKYNYNVGKDNNRACSNGSPGSSYFKDSYHGHYYSSARLTYSSTPSSTFTDLGELQGSFYAQDNNQFKYTNFIGHNYIIDVRTYYSTLMKAQDFLGGVNSTSAITKQIHNLSLAIVESQKKWEEIISQPDINEQTNTAYTPIERAKDLEKCVEFYTSAINDNMELLNKAIEREKAQISDEVLAIIDYAPKLKFSIPTQEVNGGYNIVYTTGFNQTDWSNEKSWTVSKVKLSCKIYCGDNIMIYDGISSPYVPVMAMFYRWRDDRRYI